MDSLTLPATGLFSTLGLTPELVPTYFKIRELDALDCSTAHQWPEATLTQLEQLRLIRMSQNVVTCTDPFDVLRWRFGTRCRTIFEVQSPYQSIELCRVGEDFALFLNDEIQFYSADDEGSHELMIGVPLCLAREAKRVLILGGGDGLAAREALRFESVEDIRVVELCPAIVEKSKSDATMREINGDSFNNPKTEVIVGDALAYVLGTGEKFDVVIDDCDFSVTNQLETSSREKYLHYLQTLPHRLTEGGIGSIMFSACAEEIGELKLIAEHLNRSGSEAIELDAERTFRGKLRRVMDTLFPHTLDCEYLSFFLDAEVYTYFANDKPQNLYRRPAIKSPILDEALDYFDAYLTR